MQVVDLKREADANKHYFTVNHALGNDAILHVTTGIPNGRAEFRQLHRDVYQRQRANGRAPRENKMKLYFSGESGEHLALFLFTAFLRSETSRRQAAAFVGLDSLFSFTTYRAVLVDVTDVSSFPLIIYR